MPYQNKILTRNISEDWWAVLIGGVITVAILAVSLSVNDFKFTLPAYQWSAIDELLSKVLSLQNLLVLAEAGFVFLFLSLIAVVLSGGNAKKYVSGFIVIYILAIISLIIAGNKSISNYGIEYVVFALIIG